MYLIKIIIITCFVFQNSIPYAQTLKFSEKREWRVSLRKMQKKDQEFRKYNLQKGDSL